MVAYTASVSGDWSNAATWGGGGVPGIGDTAFIPGGIQVDVDGNIDMGTTPNNQTTYVLDIGGTLYWKRTAGVNWQFVVRGNIRVNENGTLDIGTAASPIPASSTAEISMPVNLSTANHWRIYVEGGHLYVHGAVAYEMADADSQRTMLASPLASGASSAMSLQDPVDWPAGKDVWISAGGDPDLSPGTFEHNVNLASKTDASNYTVSASYSHQENAFVVYPHRNVKFEGGSTSNQGMCISGYANTLSGALNMVIDIRWAYFLYAGSYPSSPDLAAINFRVYVSSSSSSLSSDQLVLDSLVFDFPGSTQARVLHATCRLGFSSAVTISNVHSRRFYVFKDRPDEFYGKINFNNCTVVDHYNDGFITGRTGFTYERMYLNDLWYESHAPATSSSYIMVDGPVQEINNLRYYCGFQVIKGTSGYEGTSCDSVPVIISNAIINNAYDEAFELDDDVPRDFIFKNCVFTGTGYSPIYLRRCGDVYLHNCEFYGNNSRNSSSRAGCVSIYGVGSRSVECYSCTFGSNANPNNRFNNYVDMYVGYNIRGRIVFVECEAHQPAIYSLGSSWMHEALRMVVGFSGYNYLYWTDRVKMAPLMSVEFVKCLSYDSGLNELFATSFPGANNDPILISGSGGEVRKESTTTLDDTLALKALPFAAAIDNHATVCKPIRIPVENGQTVTVDVSMQKNADGFRARQPSVFLHGCGIYDSDSTTAGVFGTWESLQVTGTSNKAGIVELWFTIGCNEQDPTCSRSADNVYSIPDPTWSANPAEVDDMFSVTVYIDGLSISVA